MASLSPSRILLLATLLLGVLPHPPAQAAQPSSPLKTIAFMTDFDTKDDAVGISKAVMNGVAPGVQIIDITHQATPYDIEEGARFLALANNPTTLISWLAHNNYQVQEVD